MDWLDLSQSFSKVLYFMLVWPSFRQRLGYPSAPLIKFENIQYLLSVQSQPWHTRLEHASIVWHIPNRESESQGPVCRHTAQHQDERFYRMGIVVGELIQPVS